MGLLEFQPLSPSGLCAVLAIRLHEQSHRLSDEGLRVRLIGAPRRLLLGRGNDPTMRLVARESGFERRLVGPLADTLLVGKITPGRVIVDAEGERLSFAQEPLAQKLT